MVETIDVRDLPEEEVRLILEFVKLLRAKSLENKTREITKDKEITFASWPLGVKGKLTREEIYDYL